jgi:hypothetical protein
MKSVEVKARFLIHKVRRRDVNPILKRGQIGPTPVLRSQIRARDHNPHTRKVILVIKGVNQMWVKHFISCS